MQRKPTPLSHPFHVLFLKLGLVLTATCLWISIQAGTPLFHIECPPDVTVDCEAELWDLSIYGNAVIYGYGDPEPAGPPISTDYDLNSCNTGTIVRTWVAYDYGGNPYSCSQTITVTSTGGPLNILWPPDYTVHSCNPLTEPNELPHPYDKPVIQGGGSCAQLMMNHQDMNFNINPPACRKILRKWTVIDWCLYDPNSYYPEGIWEYTQIIKIKPENPPVIWCPPDTTVSAGADCSGGYVHLPPAYGNSDCGAGVIITNNSPFADAYGADASGTYPLGTTKVTFWADDGCGQKTSCSTYITVTDLKKPTPVCYYGVTVTLMQMPDGYYMDLRPGFFDKGSFDNCTPRADLHMWVEPSRVDCEDLGPTEVRMYVEDASGNVEYCNTLVYVQDNLGICPPPDGQIDGTILTASGSVLEDVKVSLMTTPHVSMTNAGGEYVFSQVKFGQTYTVTPADRENDMKGVTALDMAVLLKHILGVQRFSSPYHYIAADLDRSGRVSVNDLIELKDLILRAHLGAEATTGWRFVDAAFAFPDPDNPWSEPFPESYVLAPFTESMNALDFIGMKLGDLNDDAALLTSEPHVQTRNPGVTVHLPELQFAEGQVVDIYVAVGEYEFVNAMELTLRVDPEILHVLGVSKQHTGEGLDVVFQNASQQLVTALWYGAQPLVSPDLFKIQCSATRSGWVSEAIRISQLSPSVAYRDPSEGQSMVQLSFGASNPLDPDSEENESAMRIGHNYPNPFDEVTTIPVFMPAQGDIRIDLYDVNGRLLKSEQQFISTGWQEVTVGTRDLKYRGVVICRIVSDFGSDALSMVIQSGN